MVNAARRKMKQLNHKNATTKKIAVTFGTQLTWVHRWEMQWVNCCGKHHGGYQPLLATTCCVESCCWHELFNGALSSVSFPCCCYCIPPLPQRWNFSLWRLFPLYRAHPYCTCGRQYQRYCSTEVLYPRTLRTLVLYSHVCRYVSRAVIQKTYV